MVLLKKLVNLGVMNLFVFGATVVSVKIQYYLEMLYSPFAFYIYLN